MLKVFPLTLPRISSVSDCSSALSCMRDRWAWSSRLVFTCGSLNLGLFSLWGTFWASWKSQRVVKKRALMQTVLEFILLCQKRKVRFDLPAAAGCLHGAWWGCVYTPQHWRWSQWGHGPLSWHSETYWTALERTQTTVASDVPRQSRSTSDAQWLVFEVSMKWKFTNG